MSMVYSEVLNLLEKLVRHPLYYLIGIAGGRIIYQSTVEGTVDLWSSELNGDRPIRLASEVLLICHPSHTDKKIYYSIDVSGGREMAKIYATDIYGEETFEALEMEPVRIFGIAKHKNMIAYSGVSMNENMVCIAEEGDKSEKIFSTDKWIFVVDMNDKYIIGGGTLAGDPRSMEIFIYDRETNMHRIYTPKAGSFNMPSNLYYNKILFTSNYENDKKLYVYDIEEDEVFKPSLRGKDYLKYAFQDYQSYGYTENGKIWFVGLYNYRGYAYLDGYKIYHPEGTPSNLEVYNDNIYIGFSSLKIPYSIYKTRIGTEEWTKIIGMDLAKEITDRLGDTKIVRYKSFDNLEIPTVIFEAKNKKPGLTVLYVHGGPWSHVGDFWSVLITSLVVSGFHVIAPNFRGSTGYGEDFRRLDIGDPGGGDLKDIVYARKYALDAGLASKIAIMGYSYGGFMTFLATVKEPDLWHAGVAGAGVTDWKEMYELADAAFRHFQEILFAGKKEELWGDRSAINFIENLKTPLCILHPQNDTRTPLKPIIKYMNRLIELGKTFEAHIFPDMGHIITKIDDMFKLVYPAIVFLKRMMEKS